MWTVSLKQLSHYSGAVTNVLSFVIELAQFVVLLSSKIGGGGGGGGGEGEMALNVLVAFMLRGTKEQVPSLCSYVNTKLQ